jgi:hypothetical protein
MKKKEQNKLIVYIVLLCICFYELGKNHTNGLV